MIVVENAATGWTHPLIVRALARAGFGPDRRRLPTMAQKKKQLRELEVAKARIGMLKARGMPGFEDMLAAARRRNAARAAR